MYTRKGDIRPSFTEEEDTAEEDAFPHFVRHIRFEIGLNSLKSPP
jgi:hypothetical protein